MDNNSDNNAAEGGANCARECYAKLMMFLFISSAATQVLIPRDAPICDSLWIGKWGTVWLKYHEGAILSCPPHGEVSWYYWPINVTTAQYAGPWYSYGEKLPDNMLEPL